jgi:hypothetical protein
MLGSASTQRRVRVADIGGEQRRLGERREVTSALVLAPTADRVEALSELPWRFRKRDPLAAEDRDRGRCRCREHRRRTAKI